MPQAGPGEVTIEVRAAGVNPTDYKGFSGRMSSDPAALPIRPGYEVAGVIAAIGADTQLASGRRRGRRRGPRVPRPGRRLRLRGHRRGGGRLREAGRPRLPGGREPVPRRHRPRADMLRVVPASAGETVLVHGASGAVGVVLLQLLRARGVRVDRHRERAPGRRGAPVRRRARRLRRRARGPGPRARPGRRRRRLRLRRHRRGGRRVPRARAEGPHRDDRRSAAARSRTGSAPSAGATRRARPTGTASERDLIALAAQRRPRGPGRAHLPPHPRSGSADTPGGAASGRQDRPDPLTAGGTP